jgi:hypothetical protein
MSRIIYTAGLLVTGSNDVTIAGNLTVNKTISGSGELYFSASNGEPYYRMVLYDTGSGKLFMTSSFKQVSVAGNPGGSDTHIQFNDGGQFSGSNNFTFNSSTNTVNLTGSLIITGDLSAKGPFNSIQFNDAGNLSGSSEMTYDKSSGVIRMSSSKSPSITSILTETDSFSLIQNVPTTGPAYRMDLADADASGSATMMLGRQSGPFTSTGFFAKYTTGSNASEGEITMAIGKNGSPGTSGGITERFIVQSEPGPIATNGESELSLIVGGPKTGRRHVLGNVQEGTGEFATFAAGIDKEFGRKRFVVLEYSAASTSSQAGFTSSSLNGTGVGNFNPNSIPFGIDAGYDLTDTSFYIDRGGSLGGGNPVTASLEISRDGTIKTDGRLIFRSDIASEISASGRLNITSTGDQIALKADGGNVVRILAKDNVQMFGAQSSSQTAEPGPTFRNTSNKFLYAKDGVANVFVTSSLRAASALKTETLDYRGDAIAEVGTYTVGGTSPKGAIVALTGSQWGVANSGSGACASSSLAIALTGDDQGSANHYLLNGIVNLSYAPGDRIGQLLYLGDNGSASAVPPSNPAHFSIPVGYYLGDNTMYFSPDRTTGGANTVLDTISPYEDGTGPGDIQPKAGNNVASGSFSTVGGGQDNEAFGHNNFIAGGSGSIAKGTGNVILGGFANSISGSSTFSVVAGSNNVIDTLSGGSSIVTGISNTLTGVLADGIVMTGQSNSSLSKGSVIFGKNNTISGEAYYYHVGGIGNTIAGTETLQNNPGAIMGGGSNTLGLPHIGQGQIIVGGLSNTIAGYTGNSTILQGQNNIIDDALQPTQQFNKTYLLILNGEGNQITGSALANTGTGAKDKSGKFSTIVNGEANRIETGGTGTETFYKYNTIVNGSNNFVSGSGVTAGVSGMYNTIVNGDNNIIGPDISGSTIAAGSNITADRSDTVFAANLSLTNLPTSDTGLPVGAVYRDGNTLKIVT